MNKQSLTQGFLIYFADNVLVMLVATTAGTLGSTLFHNHGLTHASELFLGILFNTCLAIALYSFASSRYHAASDPAAQAVLTKGKSTTSYDATKKADAESGGGNVQELTVTHSDAADAYSHLCSMLPWIIIVPMVSIPIYISGQFAHIFRDHDHFGHVFSANLLMFFSFLALEMLFGRIYGSRPDAGSKCESMSTFLLNSLNHSCLSSAGKSLHLTETVMSQAILGKGEHAASDVLLETTLFLATTWFLLSGCWPTLQDQNTENKRFKNILMTITVYSWAFSFINTLWDAFYNHVRYGQFLYWGIMGACLLVALLLAHISGSYYGGPGPRSMAFGLMLCWTIDFGVWWAWAQIMTDIDNAFAPDNRIAMMLLVNGSVLGGLILVTLLIYMSADIKTIAEHTASRHRARSHLTAEKFDDLKADKTQAN